MKGYTQWKIGIKDKIYGYITLKLKAFEYRRGWFKLDCPFCFGEGKMGIHLGKNVVHCFKCGYVKQVLPFLMELEEVKATKDIYLILRDFDKSKYHEPKHTPIPKSTVTLPESFKLLIMGKGKYGTMARNYMKKRGFNILDLTRKGIGYCDNGKYKHYIIMPYYGEEGQLLYFQTRKYFGTGPKFNNPRIEEIGIGKSTVIYNIQALYKYSQVFIVESVMNALTLGDRAIALSGKYASNYQLFKILSSPIKDCIIVLDPDAKAEAIKLALTLVHTKGVKLVFLPEGKDVNDLGNVETTKLIINSPWLTHKDILKIKYGKNHSN